LGVGVVFDGTRIDWHHAEDNGLREESEMEEMDWEDLNDDGFGQKLAEMALEDDSQDEDWIPFRWRCKNYSKKGAETHYIHQRLSKTDTFWQGDHRPIRMAPT
jgi:hypothetical protein